MGLKKTLTVLIAAVLAVCIWTGKDIFVYIVDGYKAEKHKTQLTDWYEQVNDEQQSRNELTLIENEEEESLTLLPLEQLQQMNEDIQGWITIDGTNVNAPVVQAEDNEYYLTHNIYKEKSLRGAIFLDAQYTKESDHIVIFGHHMKDDSMFGSLDILMSNDVDATQHPITLQLGNSVENWEVYSVYIYKPEDQFFLYSFENEAEKRNFLELTQQKSVHSLSHPPTVDEQLLTLVTCYYTQYDARLIIHAKPMRDSI